MNQNRDVKGFNLFLFVLFYNYIYYNFFLTKELYSQFGSSTYIIYLLGIILVIVMTLLIPKVIESNFFLVINKHLIIRLLLGIYYLFKAFTIIVISGYLLVDNFYFNQNGLFFIFGFLVIACIISRLNLVGIINMSTIIYIMIIPFAVMSYIFLPSLDLTNVLPVKLVPKNFFFLLFFFIGIVDTFTLFQANNCTKKQVNRKWLCLGIICSYLVLAIECFFLSISASISYFSDSIWIGFTILRIQRYYEYVGSFDFVYIYIISVTCILKCAYYLGASRILFHIKKTKLCYSIFCLITVICVLLYNAFKSVIFANTVLISFILFGLCMIFYLFFIVRLRHEHKN